MSQTNAIGLEQQAGHELHKPGGKQGPARPAYVLVQKIHKLVMLLEMQEQHRWQGPHLKNSLEQDQGTQCVNPSCPCASIACSQRQQINNSKKSPDIANA